MTTRGLRRDAGGVCTLTLNRPEALDGRFADLEASAQTVGCVAAQIGRKVP